MNESKIYVNNLCETVGINNYSKYSNILVNNKIYKDKDKDKGEDKEKMNDWHFILPAPFCQLWM